MVGMGAAVVDVVAEEVTVNHHGKNCLTVCMLMKKMHSISICRTLRSNRMRVILSALSINYVERVQEF